MNAVTITSLTHDGLEFVLREPLTLAPDARTAILLGAGGLMVAKDRAELVAGLAKSLAHWLASNKFNKAALDRAGVKEVRVVG